MAENSITFTVKAKKDGSWRIVAGDAEAAAGAINRTAESTDKATKAGDRWSKGNKGVAQAGMNSTKAFSKMNQTMVGSSGLVGAYATLAANVFALTAAFGVLQRAAAAEQLAKGLEHTGLVAGRNLPYIADQLKAITGEAVSTQEAMSAVALATSSGFSSEQITQLGNVAKGASLALGRDMTDALNRLIRGAAKLEPELLDELGIMVRLDQASRDYATALGVTEGELTQYQKRQAFVTAIIREGTDAFAGIAESVDPNPYDQLAAALSDLLKDFVTLINVALIPLVNFFSNSTGGLIAGVLLFASTIKGALMPGLTGAAKNMAEFAARNKEAAIQTQQSIVTTGNLPKVYKQLSNSLKEGTATQEQMKAAQDSLNNSAIQRAENLAELEAAEESNTAKLAAKRAALQEVQTAQQQLNITTLQSIAADRTQAASNAITAASQLKVGVAFTQIREAVRLYKLEINQAAIANGLAGASFVRLKAFVYGATLSFRALGAAILTALPWVGIIGLVLATAYSYWQDWFGDDSSKKNADEVGESLKHITESGEKLKATLRDLNSENLGNSFKAWNAELKTLTGTTQQARDRIKELITKEQTAKADAYADSLEELEEKARVVQEAFQRGGNASGFQIRAYRDQAAATLKLKEGLDNLDSAPIEDLLKRAQRMATAGGLDVTADNIASWKTELEKLKASGAPITVQSLMDILNQPTGTELLSQQVESVSGAINTVDEELAKIGAKTETPFDNLMDGLNEMQKAFDQAGKKGTLDDLTKGLNKEGSDLEKAMKRLGVAGATPVEKFKTLKAIMDDNIEQLRTMPGEIKKQEAILKNLNSIRKETPVLAQAALDLEEDILNKKVNLLAAELSIYNTMELQEKNSERIKEIMGEITALNASRKSDEHEAYIVAQAHAKVDKQRVKFAQTHLNAHKTLMKVKEDTLRRDMKATALADPRRRSSALTPKEERSIRKKMQAETEEAIRQEQGLKMVQINIEYGLLEAKYDYLKAEAIAQGRSADIIDEMIDSVGRARTAALEANSAQTVNRIAGAGDYSDDDTAVKDAFMSATAQGDTTAARIQNAFAAETEAWDELQLIDKIKAIENVLNPTFEKLKEMGPDGELAAAIGEIAFNLANEVIIAMDIMSAAFSEAGITGKATFKELKDAFMGMDLHNQISVAAGAISVLASSMSALFGVIAAQYQNRIAGIDKEIEAEKKRDGQSKKSVAVLKRLEKQKEQMERKRFSAQKKMMMAQAIGATALGVAVAASMANLFPFNFVLAGIIAAMGAAQIAIIAGMSYQGGGSAPSAGATNISMGERSNKVDLARSQSGAGELAYLRGGQGVGGAENFRGAFYGRKHRAYGGETAGYVVGEQGPELFVPNRPGTIVPADDTNAALNAGGAVTFNINAIDATGVEDMLVQQQGNIIGMLRQAANSYGEEFFESVDEAPLTDPTAGLATVMRY